MEENIDNPQKTSGNAWKYATFILLAVLVVGGLVAFTGNSVKNPDNEDSNADAGVADLSVFMNNPSLYPSLGPEDAANVVIEFSDFQCPYCAMASGLPTWTEQYSSQYGDLINSAGKIEEMAANGELRFIYVPMSFLGQESVYASEAALCANQQSSELFWKMHDALFLANDAKENDGTFTKDNLKVIAQGISGLDTSQFNECLDNDQTLQDVQQVASDASKVVSGTPSFFVNGQQVSASQTALSNALA